MKKKKMYMYKKKKIFPKANTRVIKTEKSSWISDYAEPEWEQNHGTQFRKRSELKKHVMEKSDRILLGGVGSGGENSMPDTELQMDFNVKI